MKDWNWSMSKTSLRTLTIEGVVLGAVGALIYIALGWEFWWPGKPVTNLVPFVIGVVAFIIPFNAWRERP